MKVLEAKKCFFDYHRVNSKRNTIRNYELLLLKFCDQFSHRGLESITSEEVLEVLFACPFFHCTLIWSNDSTICQKAKYHVSKISKCRNI